jgi:hypothetical protein
MVFVVRIRIVVVTAAKGRRRNETLISVYVLVVSRMTLLSSYWPSFNLTKKKTKKQNNQFLATVVQEGDAKENLTESRPGRWIERNLFRVIF